MDETYDFLANVEAADLAATTPTEVTAKPGDVVELGVATTARSPVVMHIEGVSAPLQLTPSEDGGLRTLIAVGPGTTRVTAHAGAASPVEFTITADPAATDPAADTEKE
ncbi:hypothetical protein [Nocardioides sp.]|uniref:hypothetical protein n=1 Tax=Nocardioides sp. TaxID=35761 RepID=UPI002607799A|nr:hypothetical protein [Nocardioides sp.]MDI6908638.1 hypothetical protein [Nocardioides sp.]